MIYLDNASSTFPKPKAVTDAVMDCMTRIGANPGRGGYRNAVEANRMLVDLRHRLCKLVNGPDENRMILTAGCTDALNMAIKGVLREGDHVVYSMLDHNSVNRPLGGLQRAGIITTTQVTMSGDGFVDPDDFRKAMTAKTRLVILNHASNVTGLIQPAAEIGAMARQHGALFLMDAAQTVGVVDLDVEAHSCDLLAFPAHKELLAPAGIGGLYVGERAQVRPWREGGTGTRSEEPLQPDEMPYALEAGTKCMPAAVGLLASLKELNPKRNLQHVQEMMARFLHGIHDVEQIKVLGNPSPDRRVGAVALMIEDVAPEDAAAILDESFDIAVRSGLHCAPNVHRKLGSFPAGAVRVAPGPFTTAEEIDQAAKALKEIAAR